MNFGVGLIILMVFEMHCGLMDVAAPRPALVPQVAMIPECRAPEYNTTTLGTFVTDGFL